MYRTLSNFFPTLSQVILNKGLPICKNCIYYRHNKNNGASGKCIKFGAMSIITGDVRYEFAQISRDDKNLCGEKGLYYTDRNVAIVTSNKSEV